MSPVVRISDDVFARLQKLAVPLVDSVGDVIARLLDDHDGRGTNLNQHRDHQKNSAEAIRASQQLAHPDYDRAPSATRHLHDKIRELIVRGFDAETRRDQRTLVFRSDGKNFAAIQRLGLRDSVLDLSIFGEGSVFEDPLNLVKKGRFPHWSKIRIQPDADLGEVLKILRQSHSIRMRRPARER